MESNLLEKALDCLRVVKGPDARGEHTCWCPFHADGHGKPPHEPNLRVSSRGYICFACGEKGSLIQLAEKLRVSAGESHGSLEATYDYRDAEGHLRYQVCRYPGKKFRQRRPGRDGTWVWNLKGVSRVLYRLPELLSSPNATVYIAEGEKDADRLAGEGLIATTNSGGAGKWRDGYAELLKNRDVVILADNDDPGRRHAQQVACSLHSVTRSLKLIELPDLPEKGDVSDWLKAGRDGEELKALVDSAPVWHPSTAKPALDMHAGSITEKHKAQADRLVALALSSGIVLFHDDLGDAFAQLPVRDHREIWRCHSRNFRQWLAQHFWQREGKAPSSEALSSALNIIEAKARFDGEEHRLCNRVAWHEDAIWYDLADSTWRAVRITGGGWEIVDEPPLIFRRHSHQRPQLIPVPGGDLRELLPFINLRDHSQEILLLVYIVSCFIPDIPHPIPVLHGSQGAAKTTLFRVIRGLIDPSATPVLSFPRDSIELVQQLSHHWAPYYDNISTLPDGTSNLLCRAVTGEGFTKRELYSDDEDIIYQFQRCIGLNGVNIAIHKPDLLDRSILLELETIPPEKRKPEKEIWEGFELVRPRLLGAIFDALARAMSVRNDIRLPGLPRMADFALWGCAIARALGYSDNEFIAAYEGNTETRNNEVIQASPVGVLIMEMMERQAGWEGTPSELLGALEEHAEGQRVDTKARGWPKAPHSLSRRLNELRPNLAAAGVSVILKRDGRHRGIIIRKVPDNSVTSVTSAPVGEDQLALAIQMDDAISAHPEEASLEASPEFQIQSEPCDAGDAGDAILQPLEENTD